MKVAIVNRPADYVAPGVPEAIAIISIEAGKRLAASCDVVQYCGRFRGQPKTSVIDGMEYRRLPFLQDKPLVALGKLWDKVRDPRRPHYASKLFYPINAHLLARDLRESGCDVAHVHLYPQTVAVIRKYNPRLKIVLHMHCEWLNQLDRAMVEPGVAAADAIVGVSDFISERIREAFPAHADRVHTIYNAVDTARFSVSTERHHPKRILSTARLSPEKGIHVLVQAFNLVHEKAPDVELRLIGGEHLQPLSYYKKLSHDPNLDGLEKYYEGSYSEQLRNLLTPSAASKVIFAGEVDYSQMSGEYSQSDIFVHPSVWNDPSPLVLGEAMSAGVPVVATRVGGQPEIVSHGETGLLVPPNNPQALAGALLMLITDERTRERMARAARERAVQQFDWSRMASDLLALYRKLCDNPIKHTNRFAEFANVN